MPWRGWGVEGGRVDPAVTLMGWFRAKALGFRGSGKQGRQARFESVPSPAGQCAGPTLAVEQTFQQAA